MPIRIFCALFFTIFFWASAYVGIRAALEEYSPGGIALLRCMVATLCLSAAYFYLPKRHLNNIKDILLIMVLGAIGIGVYHVGLNYGEINIDSGMASFIDGMGPVVTALFAVVFLGERINKFYILGLFISVLGVIVITEGERKGLYWDKSLSYVLLAMIAGSLYNALQKPFVDKYHVIEVTTFIMWGGTLFSIFYYPDLAHDLQHASLASTATVVYLGMFPTAISYLAWSYVLSGMSTTRAVAYLYFLPFVTTLLGWLYLNEVPAFISMLGGLIAILGVWIVSVGDRRRQVALQEWQLEAA